MLVIKLLGVIGIVISSTCIGISKSRSLTARCKKLSLFLEGVNALYESIDQGGCELEDAIKLSFKKCDFLSFQKSECICDDNDLKSDKEYIEDFFKNIGFSVKKVECERINTFVLKLKNYIKEAENDVSQKARVYKSIGICVGLTIAILLV